MKRLALFWVAIAMVAGVVTALARTATRTDPAPAILSADEVASRSAREVRGATPYAEIKDEAAPKLFVDPPLPEMLAHGVVWIQWRVENVNIVPVFGKGALNVSPRVGHLHVHVDDTGWWWADASNINTIDLAGLAPGPHKIRIELVNANHETFPGQSKTVTFTIPKGAPRSH